MGSISRNSTQEFVDRFVTPYGVAFVALDFRFEDNAAGRMQGHNADNFAAYFREVSGEKSLEVRKDRARAGNIIATVRPDFGLEYVTEGEGRSRPLSYRPEPENMAVVRRIIRDVADGKSINATRNGLQDDGLKPPKGERWEREIVRSVITDDVYRPHTREELESLVSEGLLSSSVLASLNSEREYGIWWYGRRSVKTEHVEEPDPNNPGRVRVKRSR